MKSRKKKHRKNNKTTHPNHLRASLGHRLVLGQRNVGHQWRVAGDARVCVALDIGLPLPARGVWVAGADILGLQPFELLL